MTDPYIRRLNLGKSVTPALIGKTTGKKEKKRIKYGTHKRSDK
jgi:hypothetical protein